MLQRCTVQPEKRSSAGVVSGNRNNADAGIPDFDDVGIPVVKAWHETRGQRLGGER